MTNEENEDKKVFYNIEMEYQNIRLLYHCVQETIRLWPGSPARPAEEQEHLKHLRDNIYRAVLDYSFTELNTDKKDKDD